MEIKLYENAVIISYGKLSVLNGKTVNAAINAVLNAVMKELPEETRTLTNIKGIFHDCEEALEASGILRTNL